MTDRHYVNREEHGNGRYLVTCRCGLTAEVAAPSGGWADARITAWRELAELHREAARRP